MKYPIYVYTYHPFSYRFFIETLNNTQTMQSLKITNYHYAESNNKRLLTVLHDNKNVCWLRLEMDDQTFPYSTSHEKKIDELQQQIAVILKDNYRTYFKKSITLKSLALQATFFHVTHRKIENKFPLNDYLIGKEWGQIPRELHNDLLDLDKMKLICCVPNVEIHHRPYNH